MRNVSASEAKARLSELLRAAERGETALIVRHRRAEPEARLLERAELAVPASEGLLARLLEDLDDDRADPAGP